MRVPHISPSFGEMWDSTALSLKIVGRTDTVVPAFAFSHIWPKPG
jgi:hypothetical protein